MEEIQIQIDVLMLKKSDLQIAMAKPFEYGRWPNDNEFHEVTKNGIELAKVEFSINELTEVLDSIKANRGMNDTGSIDNC